METSQAVAVADSGKRGDIPWVSSYLMVRDVVKALDFYEAAFGFERRDAHGGPDGVMTHGKAAYRDGLVMMGREGSYGGTSRAPATSGVECPITTYVYCDDVDALARQAEAAGAVVRFAPMDTFYGDRICGLADPDGYIWHFATAMVAPADGIQG